MATLFDSYNNARVPLPHPPACLTHTHTHTHTQSVHEDHVWYDGRGDVDDSKETDNSHANGKLIYH